MQHNEISSRRVRVRVERDLDSRVSDEMPINKFDVCYCTVLCSLFSVLCSLITLVCHSISKIQEVTGILD